MVGIQRAKTGAISGVRPSIWIALQYGKRLRAETCKKAAWKSYFSLNWFMVHQFLQSDFGAWAAVLMLYRSTDLEIFFKN